MTRVRPYIPFTALNIVWKMIDRNSETILDIGCGKGDPMRFLNRHKKFDVTGIDIFMPYLTECTKHNNYDYSVLCDVKSLPFKDKAFDIVLCMEVLEHLEREEGLKVIDALERIAKKQVIFTTPLHHYRQSAYDNNPYQEHRYIWQSSELKSLGYKVITLGIRGMSDNEKLLILRKKIVIVPVMINILWVLAGPVARILPNLAGHMVCIKNLDTSKVESMSQRNIY